VLDIQKKTLKKWWWPVTEVEKQRIDSLLTMLQPLLETLYFRWKDERAYEDFETYKETMAKALLKYEPNGQLLTAEKRPFGFTFCIRGFDYIVAFSINSTSLKWQAKPLNRKAAK
jgi:hypothetical protein